MEFAEPAAFALAGLAVLVLVPVLWQRRTSVALPSAGGIARARPTLRMRLLTVLPVLRVAAVVLLAVAIARPRIGNAETLIPARGVDIALSLDVSSSMTSADLAPGKNRLETTKDVIREFVRNRENDRIGLVVFQQEALALSPPTLDYDALDRMIEDVQSGILPDGTGIGVGLSSALNMLRDSAAASRIVILLTDGEHNADSITPEEAAGLASALKIKVYTIGVISPGAPGGIDEDRLRAIADATGGRYFVADNEQALADVYDEIGRLETSQVGGEVYERFTELAPWFLAAAASVLAVDLLLRATWLRRLPA
ncbi:MAG: VWA domain-containing protein [Dehalococcoidia bacterium]|nr:VWA domain-containing protein [Dehalococcoidia bacterium]